MRTLKREYQAPQIISQGSAITLTAATSNGSCYDGDELPGHPHFCKCSGTGSSCKADQEME